MQTIHWFVIVKVRVQRQTHAYVMLRMLVVHANTHCVMERTVQTPPYALLMEYAHRLITVVVPQVTWEYSVKIQHALE